VISGFVVLIELDSIITFSASLGYVRGREVPIDLSGQIGLSSTLDYYRSKDIGIGLESMMSMFATLSYVRGREVPISLDNQLSMGAGLEYRRSKDIGFNLDSQMSFGVSLNFETYKQLPPTINFISKDEDSITFTLTNNDGKALSIFYEIDDDTPDIDNILVGAGATSSEITLSGLSAFTTYTLYAWAYNNGTFSGLDDYEFTTDSLGTTATPTIGSVRCKYSGSTNYVQAYITNNDTNEVTIYRNGFSIGTLSGNTSEYMTISSTSSSPPIPYNFTITAQASGYEISSEVSASGSLAVCTAL
jgi:carbon monoxide dehydrogenase subunit G